MVVMPEYLMTSLKQNPSKPRIISEVKKNCFSKLKLSFTTSLQDFGKPKYSGELLWNTGSSKWVLSIAEVRQGNLILINKETSAVELRQPLRQLNLRACSAPRTFCLAETEGICLLMFQTLSEEEYEKWVRILAAELIRQTPLHNVRFLDILSILRNKEPDKSSLKKGKSEECIGKANSDSFALHCSIKPQKTSAREISNVKEESKRQNFEERKKPDNEIDDNAKKVRVRYQKSVPVIVEKERRQKIWPKAQSVSNLATLIESTAEKPFSDESGICSEEENQTNLGIRNVEDFSFMSVKERKNFFESLNSELTAKGKESTLLMRSNSISNFKQGTHFTPDRSKLFRRKRTKSLHDLHKSPVREMCQLFESQEKSVGRDSQIDSAYDRITQRRLQRREKKLEKLTKQITDVEETIQLVTEDIKTIGPDTLGRREGLEVFAGLQKRLGEEYAKLTRLKNEKALVISENWKRAMKTERRSDNRC